jgi:hypothetical protein
MSCSVPPPLNDDDISRLLDGAADPALRDHLARCEACAARYASARRAERSLRESLRRWDCPPPTRLGDYRLGLIGGSAERAIVRHLDACAACRAELEDLRVFLAETAPAPAPAPSRVTHAAARPRWNEIMARLLPRAAATAVRGESGGPLMAEAPDGTTLILDLEPAHTEHLTINGQIVADAPDVWAGALAEIHARGRVVALAPVDDLGCFVAGPVPRDRVDLRITAPAGQTILLPDVDLAANA